MTRSFDETGQTTTTGPAGQRVHRDHLGHLDVVERQFTEVRPGVWTLVGNGLSNQTFVEGPEGIIAIDSGESVEEMTEALRELRAHTDRPVVAVIYTHFHYVEGTRALLAEPGTPDPLPIHGHARIVANKRRAGGEIGPAYGRGLVEQFGTSLPAEGPDALLHVGLGLYYRNPAHSPFTPGFIAPTDTLDAPVVRTIAGLEVHLVPAPSDADDSITVWFPELGTCVHNIVWPVLFNIFAIRGEEYRDPQVLLAGIDHIRALGAEHLVATHGPPLSGTDEIRRVATLSRDAIQFLWDQTVRGTNRGLTSDQLAHQVRLPALFDSDVHTSERYGVAEHHVRQIQQGLRGWFDGNPARLFPLEPETRHTRLIARLGGRDAVRAEVGEALGAGDIRWALELATWLAHSAEADDDDRRLLATALRTVAERTPAANIRNWCLTHARDLDGTSSLDRLRRHRFSAAQVMHAPLADLVGTLRVMLDPDAAEGIDHHLVVALPTGERAGLHVRHCIACPTDGSAVDTAPTTVATLDRATLAGLFAGTTTWSEERARGTVRIDGDAAAAGRVVACFELAGLRG